jgi:hypothetical protein
MSEQQQQRQSYQRQTPKAHYEEAKKPPSKGPRGHDRINPLVAFRGVASTVPSNSLQCLALRHHRASYPFPTMPKSFNMLRCARRAL